ncbi:Acid-sensing ion channel 2 isoform X1 [Aix galericulata]|nr:Acid-sensing ion channel 2 isoform X1 [Aix galericulata]
MGSMQPSSIQIFANTSTLHGIRHVFVYGPVTIRRLLWTLAFVGSLGLLLVESSDRVAFYFSYQHVTKVDEVMTNSLVFPAVTICNLNEFRFSRLTTNDLYHAGELLALLDVNLQIPNPHLADPAVLAILQEKANFKQYKPKVFNMQEFLARVGHDLKDMMLYCKFKGQECNHEDFKTVTGTVEHGGVTVFTSSPQAPRSTGNFKYESSLRESHLISVCTKDSLENPQGKTLASQQRDESSSQQEPHTKEKTELLSPGLPATSITKKLLGGKKSNSY